MQSIVTLSRDRYHLPGEISKHETKAAHAYILCGGWWISWLFSLLTINQSLKLSLLYRPWFQILALAFLGGWHPETDMRPQHRVPNCEQHKWKKRRDKVSTKCHCIPPPEIIIPPCQPSYVSISTITSISFDSQAFSSGLRPSITTNHDLHTHQLVSLIQRLLLATPGDDNKDGVVNECQVDVAGCT